MKLAADPSVVLYRLANDILTVQLCHDAGYINHLLHDNFRSEIRAALDSWHVQWIRLRAEAIESSSWDNLGFWKHGDQYEHALHLLLSETARPHLDHLLEMDVGRLERLKSLIT